MVAAMLHSMMIANVMATHVLMLVMMLIAVHVSLSERM